MDGNPALSRRAALGGCQEYAPDIIGTQEVKVNQLSDLQQLLSRK
ncbi:MAG: hypothetical protein QNJ74_18525 [Trichodesmium sp. MO_231.B1]|nr:hypothetical protein [Trichodesmium sp. MO_231.B1]